MPVVEQRFICTGIEHGIVVKPLLFVLFISEHAVHQQIYSVTRFQFIIIFFAALLQLIFQSLIKPTGFSRWLFSESGNYQYKLFDCQVLPLLNQ